jgi:HTH-type transcriptional regulator/antitoxin HigA
VNIAPARIPAEVFPPGELIEEEMNARGWDEADIARRMGSARAYETNLLCVMLIIAVRDVSLILDEETANGLGRAFGVSPQYFLNLDALWRRFGPPSRHATAH